MVGVHWASYTVAKRDPTSWRIETMGCHARQQKTHDNDEEVDDLLWVPFDVENERIRD